MSSYISIFDITKIFIKSSSLLKGRAKCAPFSIFDLDILFHILSAQGVRLKKQKNNAARKGEWPSGKLT